MARPKLSGIHHVKIPVTNMPESRQWYERVFDWRPFLEFPDADGVVRGYGGRIPGLGDALVSLRANPEAAAGCNGFDPVGFAVDGPEDLAAWIAHLDGLGIRHSPLIEASIGWLLVFSDPDGIEIHLYTWASHGKDHSDRPGYGRVIAEDS